MLTNAKKHKHLLLLLQSQQNEPLNTKPYLPPRAKRDFLKMKATFKFFLCVLLAVGAVSATENVKMVGLRKLKASDREVETGRRLGKSDKGAKPRKDGKPGKGDSGNKDRTGDCAENTLTTSVVNSERERRHHTVLTQFYHASFIVQSRFKMLECSKIGPPLSKSTAFNNAELDIDHLSRPITLSRSLNFFHITLRKSWSEREIHVSLCSFI